MIEKKPYILYNAIQHYEWGTIGKDAFIPNLLDIPVEDKPYAELWIGAHPKLSSKLEINDELIELQKAIDDFPNEILGERVSRKFNNKLPFLLKILSARKALSIQTHPNKEQAKLLHSADPVNYPDDNHKPEIAIVLTSLQALLGFRTQKEIFENLNKYPPIIAFLGSESVDEFKQSLQNSSDSAKAIKNLFSALITNSQDDQKLKKCIDSINRTISLKDDISEDEKLFIKLFEEYDYDIGLLTIFFLNYIKLIEGESIFTDAGVPHAYLKGDIVECMANSDNVVRAGLTPKFKDIDTLLSIMDYRGFDYRLEGERISDNIINYSPPIEEFQIEKFKFDNNGIELSTKNQVEILLVTEGNANIYLSDGEEGILTFEKGEAVLIPALIDKYKIYSENDTQVFRVTIP